MSSQDPLIQYFLQFGGFGLAAYCVWWLTRKLNGKLDALVRAVQHNSTQVNKLTAAIERDRYLRHVDLGEVEE